MPVTIEPMLNVRLGATAVAFYRRAFDAQVLFEVGEGEDVVAQLSIEGATFWVATKSPNHGNPSPQTCGGSSVRIVLTVPDPDAVFNRAIDAGATEVWPVDNRHGWRIGRVQDPFGHQWEIGRIDH